MKELSLSRASGPTAAERSEEERSETERSADAVGPARPAAGAPAASAASPSTAASDPEVLEKPQRRRFPADYKLRILREADRCDRSGQIGALLRREGLYSSLLSSWRIQRDAGALGALGPKKRGPRKAESNPLAPQVARLQKEKTRLEKKLKQAEAIIEFQKKIAAMLDIPMSPFDDEEND